MGPRFLTLLVLAPALACPSAWAQFAQGVATRHAAQWYRNGAALDLDFVGQQYMVSTTTANLTPSSPIYLAAGEAFAGRGSTATYFDSGGVLQTAAVDTARVTYDPTNGNALLGTLLEPAATNSLPYSNMSGAVAGSPGTLPTNWGHAGATTAGLACKVSATGVEYGMNYIELNYSGTSTGSAINIFPANTTSIAVAPSEVWDATHYVKLPYGAGMGLASVALTIATVDGSNANTGTQTGAAIPPPSSLARLEVSYTMPGTAAKARQQVKFTISSGTTVDFTVRLYGPQMEKNAFATSYIPTTAGSPVSRAADTYTANLASGTYTSLTALVRDAGATFSRGSAATYYDSGGILQTAAANVPRLDHDPSQTGVPQGLLIEGAATNLISNSQSATGMIGAGTPAASISSTTGVTAPDGVSDMLKCVGASGGGTTCRWKDLPIALSTAYTASVYLKGGDYQYFNALAMGSDGTYRSIYVNLANATVSDCGNSLSTGTEGIRYVGNGIYRIWMTYTNSATSSGTPYFDIRPQTNPGVSCVGNMTGDGASGYYFWGVQVEAGSVPTSYIKTTGSKVTRTSDNFYLPTNAGNWYTADTGTLGAVGSIPVVDTSLTRRLAMINDGLGNQNNSAILTYSAGSRKVVIQTGGLAQHNNSQGAAQNNQIMKLVAAFAPASNNSAVDGTVGTPNASASLSGMTHLTIGSQGIANHLGGHIRRLWYMPSRQPNASLPAYSR